MDPKDMNSLDRAIRYEPTPDPLLHRLVPWIAAVIIVSFIIWILGMTL